MSAPVSPEEPHLAKLPTFLKQTATITTTEQTTANFLDELRSQFQTDPAHIERTIHASLLHALESPKRISLLPTNIAIPPHIEPGAINGDFLSLDVGGSTVRIALVRLSTTGVKISKQKQWILKESEKIIDTRFFDILVQRSLELLDGNADHQINIGVTWSFPLTKDNVIITMGKGFHVTQEVEDKSLNSIIEERFAQVAVDVDVKAVINDSIAVNLAGLLDTTFQSDISLIIGTGLNSCVSLNNVLHNIELGFFGKLDRPTTYDLKIDERWNNDEIVPYMEQDFTTRIFQPLEFLCSSRYVCEVFRLIILDLVSEGLITLGDSVVPDFLSTEYELHGALFVLLENKDLELVGEKLRENYDLSLSIKDLRTLNQVVEIILERSSHYLVASLRALQSLATPNSNSKGTSKPVSINVNFIGSFLQHSLLYQKKITESSTGVQINLKHVQDSSVIGAAVAAFLKTI